MASDSYRIALAIKLDGTATGCLNAGYGQQLHDLLKEASRALLDSNDGPSEPVTCATCKHRGDDPVDYGWREDNRPVTFYECKRVAHDDDYQFDAGGEAVVIDGSGYLAQLCVEKSFSCKFHERHTEVQQP